MGEVAIRVKVTPESPESNLEKIGENIGEKFPVNDSEEKSIGFGLDALKVLIVRDEEEGGTDDIENAISDMETVASVEVEDVTLI